MHDPVTGYPIDADGRVVLEFPAPTYVDIRCADGHVYTQDALRRIRVWPFHVIELLGAGYRPYVEPATEAEA